MAYEKFSKDELILRDKLAIQRTKLAEERTYLAYIRTGFSLILAGFFFLGYFTEGTFHYLGYGIVVVSTHDPFHLVERTNAVTVVVQISASVPYGIHE